MAMRTVVIIPVIDVIISRSSCWVRTSKSSVPPSAILCETRSRFSISSTAASATSSEAAEHTIWCMKSTPSIRFCTVEYGMMMMSSWSIPMAFSPFSFSVPMTLNGMLPTRMIFPIGSSFSPKRFSTIVCPMRPTLAYFLTSSSVKLMPVAISYFLIWR